MKPLIILFLCCVSSVFSNELNNNIKNVTKTTTGTTNQPVTDVHHHVAKQAKTDSEERQLCPTCGGSDCNTNMTSSGLPIIQVLIALGVGILWAKIFVWLFKNFYEKGNSDSPAPQYGVPQPQYGVPASSYGAPQSTYGAPPASQYGAPSSRNFNTDFLNLSKTVWKAIKDFSES